jgi:hypothetical protein
LKIDLQEAIEGHAFAQRELQMDFNGNQSSQKIRWLLNKKLKCSPTRLRKRAIKEQMDERLFHSMIIEDTIVIIKVHFLPRSSLVMLVLINSSLVLVANLSTLTPLALHYVVIPTDETKSVCW